MNHEPPRTFGILIVLLAVVLISFTVKAADPGEADGMPTDPVPALAH